MFVPAALAIVLSYYVCDLILSREMIEVKRLHKVKKMLS
jgi:hypothetical protein